MYIVALFMIILNWKQCKCEWLNNLQCLLTMEYYLAIKMNKILKHTKTGGFQGTYAG